MNEADAPKACAGFLASVLPQIQDAVRFAEAKNGMMITLTSAGLFGTVTLLCQADLPHPVNLGLLASLPLILAAGLLALTSFLPTLDRVPGVGRKSQATSLFFFGAIAGLDPERYLRLVAERFQEERANRDPLCRDYAAQVVIVSRIALRKLLLFRLSVAGCIAAFVVFSIAFFVGRLGYLPPLP